MGQGGDNGIPFSDKGSADDGPSLTIGAMFELLLVEWHLTPEYIIDNWTDEKLDLMAAKLVERKQREAGIKPDEITDEKPPLKPGFELVSDVELLAKMGIKVEKKKERDERNKGRKV